MTSIPSCLPKLPHQPFNAFSSMFQPYNFQEIIWNLKVQAKTHSIFWKHANLENPGSTTRVWISGNPIELDQSFPLIRCTCEDSYSDSWNHMCGARSGSPPQPRSPKFPSSSFPAKIWLPMKIPKRREGGQTKVPKLSCPTRFFRKRQFLSEAPQTTVSTR